jgi:hypothetical protein
LLRTKYYCCKGNCKARFDWCQHFFAPSTFSLFKLFSSRSPFDKVFPTSSEVSANISLYNACASSSAMIYDNECTMYQLICMQQKVKILCSTRSRLTY